MKKVTIRFSADITMSDTCEDEDGLFWTNTPVEQLISECEKQILEDIDDFKDVKIKDFVVEVQDIESKIS